MKPYNHPDFDDNPPISDEMFAKAVPFESLDKSRQSLLLSATSFDDDVWQYIVQHPTKVNAIIRAVMLA